MLACRIAKSCNIECDCIDLPKLNSWLNRSGNGCNENNGGNGNGGYNGHGHGGCYYCRVASGPGEPEAAVLEQVWPNPFSASTTISFSLAKPQFVRITIFDLSGKIVAPVTDALFGEGYYEVPWSPAAQMTGMYLLRMETNSYQKTVKVAIIE